MNDTDFVIALTALVAQGLKEMGIPSPGVTQGALVYAGYRLVLGDYATGLVIIAAVGVGSALGAATAYTGGRFFGYRLCKYLRLTPQKLEHLKRRLGRGALLAVMFGRFVPALMAPLSAVAGMLRLSPWHFAGGTLLAQVMWITLFVMGGSLFGQAFGEFEIPTALPMAAAAIVGLGLMSGIAIFFWRRQHSTPDCIPTQTVV